MTNKQYVEARNSLIPEAEAHANAVAGEKPQGEPLYPVWAEQWNRVFHCKMNELAKAQGLVC